MKELKMMSGRSIIISDEEVDKIRDLVKKEYRGLIGLSSGEMINLASVESITNPELFPFYLGNPMSKDKTKVFVGGEWKFFSGNKEEIEYKPKLQNYDEPKLLQ